MPLTSPEAELQSYLEPNERLLWSGTPRGGIKLRAQDAVLIPFSVLWCGFAIFWTVSVSSTNAPAFFKLWGLMFVGIGLFFVFGRFFTDSRKRRNTFYGVTNRRVLILSGLAGKELRSLNLRAIPEILLKQHADGSGTISFGSATFPGNGAFRGWPGSEKYLLPAFEFIDDPQAVHRLVLAQQENGGR